MHSRVRFPRSMTAYASALALATLVVLVPAPEARADTYTETDKLNDACLASSAVHPHRCDQQLPSPLDYASLDIESVSYVSTGSRLDITAQMKGAIPTAPPGNPPPGTVSAAYRFFFTKPNGAQWCVNLVIWGTGSLTNVGPVWTIASTLGRWDSGVGSCTRQEPLDGTSVSGDTITWEVPYGRFGGSAGQVLRDLGGWTDGGYHTPGVRVGGIRHVPSGARLNTDIGPDDCDPAGLHGGECSGSVTL